MEITHLRMRLVILRIKWKSSLTSAVYRQHDSSHFALNIHHKIAFCTQ